MTDTVADVLERAADLIAPPGAWGQGLFGLGAPCMCAVGAIGNALGTSSPTVAENWVDRRAAPFLGKDAADLEEWNDAPRRTQDEVVAKLREAAAKARAESIA